ncbi:MAG TPA: hypothetical protein VHU15_05370 [Stellaceae bacterium]|nr:hypothetical protein [Stellaceae bacterium]
MQRVAVIGNSGGGKSVLARRIVARFALPYVEIDRVYGGRVGGWRRKQNTAPSTNGSSRKTAGSSTVWGDRTQWPPGWRGRPTSC